MASVPCPLSYYPELDRMAGVAASALLASGLKKGDLILLRATSSWETICLLFAAWRCSITVFLLSPRLPSPPSSITPSLVIQDPAPFFLGKENHLHRDLDTSFLSLLLLTSGSTGTPKLAAFTLRQLFESAHTVIQALSAERKDIWHLSLPLNHVGGLGVLLRALLSGGTLLLEKTISPKARFASLVPTQLYRLLKEEGPLPSTHFLIGGSALSKQLHEKAVERGLSFSVTYGLTEMSSTVILSKNQPWPYLGFPLPGREIMLSSEGELLLRGVPLFEGYGYPPTPPGTWFSTGDLGGFHKEFGFFIRGRKDFQFMSGGENIQPEEIEAALLSHPEVEYARVVPTPDEEFGARPIAYIQTPLSSEQLISFLSPLLPKFKIPIAFIREDVKKCKIGSELSV
jgi:O-succinylbenzoic acid--CoA ligase